MGTVEPTTEAFAALAEGRWVDARTAFEATLLDEECPEAYLGLATAHWWLGENRASLERCRLAYSLFRGAGDDQSAVQCAVWMAITYKANYANFVAANGWLRRAERLLAPLPEGALHGWVLIARGYREPNMGTAEGLTERALELARTAEDVDLELVAMSQLGLVRVGRGDIDAGFGLIDEAVAAALAGERSNLDTVAYACCDMLIACELASDLERAAQWCTVADDFVTRYGCPFLYAECRISYGTVLTARGRWDDAERELQIGMRVTEGACPGLHGRALARLAGLRVRQGRIEEAEQLLTGLDAGIDAETWLLAAAVALARGDAGRAGRLLEERLRHAEHQRWMSAAALDLLVDAHIVTGRVDAAIAAAERLRADVDAVGSRHLRAIADGANGRVMLAAGDLAGIARLQDALAAWETLQFPLEAARTHHELARALTHTEPETAREHAHRAFDAFVDLGASIDADRSAALLRSFGASPRSGARQAGVLTRREQEVLRLLATGLTNPEIAARLHVSRKTASHHVSSILTKLGVRNRAEAAAHATDLLDQPADAPSDG